MVHEVMIEQLGKQAVKKDVPYAAAKRVSRHEKSRARSMDPDARQRLLMAASSRT